MFYNIFPVFDAAKLQHIFELCNTPTNFFTHFWKQPQKKCAMQTLQSTHISTYIEHIENLQKISIRILKKIPPIILRRQKDSNPRLSVLETDALTNWAIPTFLRTLANSNLIL